MMKQHNKQFKEDAVKYYIDHKELWIRGCAQNLDIGTSTLSKWIRESKSENGLQVRGSGNYSSDEQKEISRLKRELRDTKDPDFSSKLENILDEQFNPDTPNAVWCTDITYIWTNAGFVYLTSVMDLFSRKVIAWTLSETLEVSCVINTINKAKRNRKLVNPVIIHSDRGSQYVSKEYKKATSKMILSYSKKAYPWDNACIESFHAIIKREWINRFRIKNYRHAYILVFEYIETFYNTTRIHSHCNYMSPNEFEKAYEEVKKSNVTMAS